jgi:hypothetical protein
MMMLMFFETLATACDTHGTALKPQDSIIVL